MVARSDSHAHSRARSHSPVDGRSSPPVIFPRRKAGQNKRPATHHPVVVTYEILSQQFDVPLWKACRALGICATAMKKVCRKLGVMKWPYKENHMPGNKKCAKAASSPTASVGSSDSSTEDSPPSPISPVQTPPLNILGASSRRTPTAARPIASRAAAPVRGSTRAASAAAAARVAALCAREREPIESGSEVSTPSQAATPGDARPYEEEYECDARAAYQPAAPPRRYEQDMAVVAPSAFVPMARPQASQVVNITPGGDVYYMGYEQNVAPAPYYAGYPVAQYPVAAAPSLYPVAAAPADDFCAPAKANGVCEAPVQDAVRIATGMFANEDEYYSSSDGWLEEPDLMGASGCEEDFNFAGEDAAPAFTTNNNFLMCF